MHTNMYQADDQRSSRSECITSSRIVFVNADKQKQKDVCDAVKYSDHFCLAIPLETRTGSPGGRSKAPSSLIAMEC
ncbi:hypothetical protein OUZ56_013490 [Daphnia magna]|uniref:Uncharacterized protein n=1 Tax=Daphnia magna TaxID=35525 RepID=A0ABQ9Z6U5_9CRUS|nr:hypothetical protein OUZ56_013490 [Daphnia magna]